jgi:hypothetical protein
MAGLGFDGEKRAGVRDPRLRRLEPKVQEAVARTAHETLRRIFDDVGLDEIAEAMRRQGFLEDEVDELAAARWQLTQKWAWADLNGRPHAYQACALTN